MSTRLRLAIVASVIVGTLVGGFYYAWQRRPSVVHEFEWGRNLSGPVTLNSIRAIDTSEVARRRFSYYTGAQGSGTGPRASAPTHVLAEAADGRVSVRLLGFAERDRAHDEALEIARIVSAATTQIFPAPPVPVEIDVHVMPNEAPFSLAKRVDWRDGRAYALAIFARERGVASTAAAHELYHVLALRYSLRRTPVGRYGPNAALSYEEATADLFAACGELLAQGSLSRVQGVNRQVVVEDRTFNDVLAGDELAAALALIASDSPDTGPLGYLLSLTALDHVFGNATEVALDSPQAATLLALCKKTAGNPFALDAWMADLVPPASGASSAATP